MIILVTLALIDQISVTDLLLIIGVAAVIADRVAENRGWSRSSKILRAENEDLVRRNAELEDAVTRHERELGDARTRIKVLEELVDDLKKRDQAAVLSALQNHEVRADARHGATIDVLKDILTSIKEGSTP